VRRHRAAGTVQGRGFAYGHGGLLILAGLCSGRSNHGLLFSMRSRNRRRQRTRCASMIVLGIVLSLILWLLRR